MKAYTDEYIVKSDGIYRIERIYHPGGDWEQREVLWLPRDVLMTALSAWLTFDGITANREDGFYVQYGDKETHPV
jgi:hypothetical protein